MRSPREQERDLEPKTQEQGQPLTRIQKWTRAAVVGLLLPLAASTAATAYVERSHHPVAPVSASDPKADTIPGTLHEERILNPDLTEDGYLDFLAAQLTTPERLDRFVQEHFQYVTDTTNHPAIFPRTEKNDYWQKPIETVQRVQSVVRRTDVEEQQTSVMLGDCEDLAFLVQEILWRQGKVAYAVNTFDNETGHTVCIWTEERSDGRYDGYSVLDEGVMRNGGRPGSLAMSDDGFDTPSDAFFSAVALYTDKANSVHPAYISTSCIRGPFRYTDAVTIQSFNHSLPHLPSYIDFLATMGVFTGGYAAYRSRRQRREGETWKEYFTQFRVI